MPPLILLENLIIHITILGFIYEIFKVTRIRHSHIFFKIRPSLSQNTKYKNYLTHS